jgi:hypothetical protein
MTQRERHASGGVFEGTPRLAARPSTRPPSAPGLDEGTGWAPLWEDVFRNASAAQQQELLSLAGRQGVLYAHQLPAPSGGVSTGRQRQLLTRLLNGHIGELEPVRTTPVAVLDTDLDPIQREGVARALQTPDVALIQGLPGTGKSRVVAEILTQAAAAGERVLFLAPHAAALDRVLDLVTDREVLCPIRCLGRDEALATLPPASRAMTLAERSRRLREHTLPGAGSDLAAAEQRVRAGRGEAPLWQHLEELAEQRQQLLEQTALLQQARASIPAEVEQEAAACERPADAAADIPAVFAALRAAALQCAEVRVRVERELAVLNGQAAERRQEQDALTARFVALRPLADAKEHKRWWTGTWWRATFQGDVLAKAAELQNAQQKVQAELEANEKQAEQLRAELAREEEQVAAVRKRLVQVEMARRLSVLDEREAALRHDLHLIEEKGHAACLGLQPDTQRPTEITPLAVREARQRAQTQLKQAEDGLSFAKQWVTCLEEVAESFPARLLGLCNVVAATLAAFPADPHFGEAGPDPVRFDLLVLEEAEQVTESEFLNVARRAARCVLVGQPGSEGDESPASSAPPERAARPVAGRAPPRLPPALRPGFFPRLWRHLHCDPRRLPYAWVQEKDGLCCQLRPVTPEQSQWLESERVADFPEIELRILAQPRCEPRLAEVVFPASMSITQAKAYIFNELAELPVRAPGHSLRWVEEADRLLLHLAPAPLPGALSVVLQPGLREMVAPAGTGWEGDGTAGREAWQTCCLEFEHSAGWQRPRAEEWVRQHLGLRDLGRTVRFDVCYRMTPPLAGFLADLLFADSYRSPATLPFPDRGHGPAGSVNGSSAAVDFVAVPPLRDGNGDWERDGSHPAGSRSRTTTLPRSSAPALARKGGAGLELDLSDSRHRDRLPAELRGDLPGQGFVNLLEAQAVVRHLEAFVADPSVRGVGGETVPTIGVMALYPGQAQLIRRLMQSSATLAASNLDVKVDVPSAFREQECWISLVSLTRSHTHRAVSFGEGPPALALALTRARARLVLFGDPGTLARRSQWENPLDNLDEAASARERHIVSQLVDYLHGRGPHPEAFHLCEGGSA